MIKFRAHSVGNLLVGGNQITDRQIERLRELADRQLDPDARPLTSKMMGELSDLIAKRDAPFEFGATALAYIRDVWLRNEFDYDEPVFTNEILKGLICEEEAIEVLERQLPGGWRVKNEDLWENAWFTGTPDIILAASVEDVKCPWTIKTYFDVRTRPPLYYAQGQVYMDLTGRDTFRLCYVLLDTPEEIVVRERQRFLFRFDGDESNPYYQECCKKVNGMHSVSNIPEDQRIKVFEFHRDDAYLAKLHKRVEQAREVYDALTLKG